MDPPIVKIPQGQLKGGVFTDLNGSEFLSFLGIPYAKPPLGDLRFKAPLPCEPWTGIRDATQEGDICYSRVEFTADIRGSEDCLHLNVFTKELPQSSRKLKPVMVFIHGGGFTVGSKNIEFWGPEFLMTEDIVLVSINYRLGALGFLTLADTSLEVPGNAGLKDQAMAFKWVQDNIKYFNGDPGNVTIFGSSAGSASVHFHILSEHSKGLFHKAILQSGLALNCWVYGSQSSIELANNLGHEVNDEKEALEVLRKCPVEKLFEAQEKLGDALKASQRRKVGAVIENPNPTAVITRNVIDIIKSGEYNHVPMMMGYSTREGLLVESIKAIMAAAGITAEDEPFSFRNVIPWQVDVDEESQAYQSICKKLEDLYFKGADQADNMVMLNSDSLFVAGIMFALKNHVTTSLKPIYLYRMSLEAGLNFLKVKSKIEHFPGASHVDDLGYLFKSIAIPEPGSLEDISVRRFVKLWTNFAKYGNPTPDRNELGITWLPVEEKKINFLDIGKDLTVGVNPEPERMALWKEIYQLNRETAEFL